MSQGKINGTQVAFVDILPSKSESYIVIGTNVLRTYYTVFDCEHLAIGFVRYTLLSIQLRLTEFYSIWPLLVIGVLLAGYALYTVTIDSHSNYGPSSDEFLRGGN